MTRVNPLAPPWSESDAALCVVESGRRAILDGPGDGGPQHPVRQIGGGQKSVVVDDSVGAHIRGPGPVVAPAGGGDHSPRSSPSPTGS